jgi:hypothetical protein
MIDPELLRQTLADMDKAQKDRFKASGMRFIEFFSSREELDFDAAMSCVRHLLWFAEMNMTPNK